MLKSTPDLAIMIKPLNFGYNHETAESNSFQEWTNENRHLIHAGALGEFYGTVQCLVDNNIKVLIIPEKKTLTIKPDAIFSNNWVVYMPNGQAYTMPMLTKNRQAEVDASLIHSTRIRFFHNENDMPLEGTGSMVLDHKNKRIYAALSSRTNEDTLDSFANETGYELVKFNTVNSQGLPVYHTNVVMALGENWVVICNDVINQRDQNLLLSKFKQDNKRIIEISEAQMNLFCANIFEMQDSEGNLCTIMSSTAHTAFRSDQIELLQRYTKLIITAVSRIEKIGGGGVRCMITGSFIQNRLF